MTQFEFALRNKGKVVKHDLFIELKDKTSEFDVTVETHNIKYGESVELYGHKFTFDNSMSIQLDDAININKGSRYLLSESLTVEFSATCNKLNGYGFYAVIKVATC